MKIIWREEDDTYLPLGALKAFPLQGFVWQKKREFVGNVPYVRLLGTHSPNAGGVFLCRVDGETSEEERKGIERLARLRYAEFFEQE